MRSPAASALLATGFALLALCACGSDAPPEDVGAPAPSGCTEPAQVACEDEVIQGMNLQATVASGEVRSEPDGAGFRSFIDATAGGAFATSPDAYVYARFTDSGLEKVAISDEESLGSMDWDIAFRRYVIRINSGNSGPSCVSAARLPGAPDYDALASAPDDLRLRKDEYFTESCELIADGSGLDSPATALSGYWDYSSCLAMSGVVYVIALADGRQLKLTVTHYYSEEDQAECNETGMVSATGSAANFQIRWAFLP